MFTKPKNDWKGSHAADSHRVIVGSDVTVQSSSEPRFEPEPERTGPRFSKIFNEPDLTGPLHH